MAITIVQKPYAKVGPAVQDWNWCLTSTNSASHKFKYVCDMYFFNGTAPGATPSVRLKFSGNIFGAGLINLRQHIEQQVSTDRLASIDQTFLPSFKGSTVDFLGGEGAMPVHLIDKFTLNNYNFKRLTIKWGEEYANNSTDPVVVYPNLSIESSYGFWNGVVPYGGQRETTSINSSGGVGLTSPNGVFGGPWLPNTSTARFLSNAPITQYVREGDYMSLGLLAGKLNATSATWVKAQIILSNDSGNLDTFYITTDTTGSNDSGGYNASVTSSMTQASRHLQYLGCGPANLQWSSDFTTNWAACTEYRVRLTTNALSNVSKQFIFKKQYDDCKGFDTVRLTWLNRMGTWDYYNFTKKSYREVKIDREFTKGDKNDYNYIHQKHESDRVNATFSVKAKEIIKANTDWVDDETSIWLEELYTSPDVYMLGSLDATDNGVPGPQTDRHYVRPVQVSSKKYERYSSANDKVAQYEIEIELDSFVPVQKNQTGYITYG